MVGWIDPIFDRTQADVDFAIRKIEEWKAMDGSLAYDLKGCINASDLNRIERDITYLSERLADFLYTPDTVSKEWSVSGMPTAQDIERILYNAKSLVSSFHRHPDAPDVPLGLSRYEELNALEKNLYLIRELLETMVSSFKKSGTFYSGSTFSLPIGR